jgi:hydrogenase maturation protease
MSADAVPPLLVLAWGNPSRGDDALGPLLAERVQAYAARHLPPGRVEVLTDFQLHIEHALDLCGRQRVLLADAECGLAQPFAVRPLQPARGAALGSHALAPAALLQVCGDLYGQAPPATLLGIRARQFQLGAPPSAQALADLASAWRWVRAWLRGTAPACPEPPTRLRA